MPGCRAADSSGVQHTSAANKWICSPCVVARFLGTLGFLEKMVSPKLARLTPLQGPASRCPWVVVSPGALGLTASPAYYIPVHSNTSDTSTSLLPSEMLALASSLSWFDCSASAYVLRC